MILDLCYHPYYPCLYAFWYSILSIFCNCFLYLYNIGISVTSPDGVVISKAKLLMCSVDLPARALVLNMKQYNGKFACAYCENEGTPRATSALDEATV